MNMRLRISAIVAGIAIASAALVTGWIAFPTHDDLKMPAPLQAWTPNDPSLTTGQYAKDFAPLATGFRPQNYRSFCGPASIATVLRAYGVKQAHQTAIFPSLGSRVQTFYTGVSLQRLAALARNVGLRSEIAYADTLGLSDFRERLKANLRRGDDFVLINYDRRVLKQSGAGHISPVGAYDETRDAFLVLDEASYKYPFTWIPTPLLYAAVHTRDGERFRGVLFIQAYEPPG